MSLTVLFLQRLSDEIRYSRSNISEIIYRICSEASFGELDYLSKCNEYITGGYDFPFAWRKSVETTPLYKSKEKEKIIQLGNFLGTSDCESQVNTINLYSAFFEKYHSEAVKDSEKYVKLACVSGIFIGASVFILLY